MSFKNTYFINFKHNVIKRHDFVFISLREMYGIAALQSKFVLLFKVGSSILWARATRFKCNILDHAHFGGRFYCIHTRNR